MIVFERVNTKTRRGKDRLSDLSFEIHRGESIVLLGHAGSGATTILRLINRMTKPDSGSILIDGEDSQRIARRQLRHRTGYVLREIGLFPHLSIRKNIALGLKAPDVSRRERRRRTERALRIVGQPTKAWDLFPSRLSRLSQQKVAIGRALVGRPDVVLMRDPFGSFPVGEARQLRRWLRNIRQKTPFTQLLSTSDPAEAVFLADRIMVLKDGELIQDGTPRQIMDRPSSSYVSRLFHRQKFQIKLDNIDLAKIMINNPRMITLSQEGQPVTQAVRLMKRYQIGTLLVTDHNRRFQGIIRFSEIQRRPSNTKISDVIDNQITAIEVNESFTVALNILLENNEEYLPVIDQERRVKGLITRHEIAQLLPRLF